MYKDISCLDLGKANNKKAVPMEFCVLVEGQRYPKEHLDRNAGTILKNLSLVPPRIFLPEIVNNSNLSRWILAFWVFLND